MQISTKISDEAYKLLAEEETKRKLAKQKDHRKGHIVDQAIISFLKKE